MFGDSSFVLMTEAERTGSHYIEIVNPDSADYVRIRLDFQTGRVTLTRQDGSEKSFLLDATALARFISTDPLAEKYPGLSPYNYVANNPIILIDPDGREIYLVIDGQAQKVTRAQLENPDNNSMVYQSLRASLEVEDNYVSKYLENAEHDVYIGIGSDPTNTLPNAQKFNKGEGSTFEYDGARTVRFFGVSDVSDFGEAFNGLDLSATTDAGKTYSLITLNEGFYGDEATQETKKAYFNTIFGSVETDAILQSAYELNHEFGAHIDHKDNLRFPGNPHMGSKANPQNPWNYLEAEEMNLIERVKKLRND
jgi:hypothetical protein